MAFTRVCAVHKHIYWLFYSTAELQKSNKLLTDNILLFDLVSYTKIHWEVCVRVCVCVWI